MRNIHVSAITDAVKKLCMEANYELEPDMLRAFDRALGTERSPAGQQVLQILKDNAELARTSAFPTARTPASWCASWSWGRTST